MPMPPIQIRIRIQPEKHPSPLSWECVDWLTGWLAGWMLKFPSLWPAAANWNNERGFNYRSQTIVWQPQRALIDFLLLLGMSIYVRISLTKLSASSGGGSHSFLCKQKKKKKIRKMDKSTQTKPAVPHPTKDNRNVRRRRQLVWKFHLQFLAQIKLTISGGD